VSDRAVAVSDLVKHYGAIHAVDGVSFAIERGEVFGILGPNGAGKTTTIECIEGLRQPDGGAVEVLGVPRGGERPEVRQRIGVQLQTTGFFPKLTVREILGMFGALYSQAMSPEEAIELVSLGESATVASAKLSGGQRQRLSLALALLNRPDLVFLDEPTTGLDPQSRRALWDVIRNLREEGRTVLLTTHYMEEAQELCRRVAIMDHGKIIELDTPDALVRKHFRETAIEVAASAGLTLDRLSALPAVANCTQEAETLTLYSADVPRTMAALFEWTQAEGLPLNGLTIRQATLEDVFLKITGRRIRG
jgi:ABC-2 type transport system ATP-binding protein